MAYFTHITKIIYDFPPEICTISQTIFHILKNANRRHQKCGSLTNSPDWKWRLRPPAHCRPQSHTNRRRSAPAPGSSAESFPCDTFPSSHLWRVAVGRMHCANRGSWWEWSGWVFAGAPQSTVCSPCDTMWVRECGQKRFWWNYWIYM